MDRTDEDVNDQACELENEPQWQPLTYLLLPKVIAAITICEEVDFQNECD